MDPRHNPEPEVEPQEDQPFGSSKGEMISMILFGLMVIIASACFVIW